MSDNDLDIQDIRTQRSEEKRLEAQRIREKEERALRRKQLLNVGALFKYTWLNWVNEKALWGWLGILGLTLINLYNTGNPKGAFMVLGFGVAFIVYASICEYCSLLIDLVGTKNVLWSYTLLLGCGGVLLVPYILNTPHHLFNYGSLIVKGFLSIIVWVIGLALADWIYENRAATAFIVGSILVLIILAKLLN